MPLYKQNGKLYEVIKTSTIPGQPLEITNPAYRASVTITRPNDASPYLAGDVVGSNSGSAIITLPNIGPAGGYIIIQSVRLIIGSTSVPAGMGAFRLHLYMATPTAIADNAPFDLTSGEVANYVGYIELPAPQDLGSTLFTQTDYAGTLVKLASSSTTLYAELETRGAYTPSNSSTYDLRVLTLEAGV